MITEPTPIVLIPGLNCSAKLYAKQTSDLWRFGSVTIADHTRDDDIPAIARRVLAGAPPQFALVGFSLGGYVALEIMRLAPDRVLKLALLDTSARPDTPEQKERRAQRIALVQVGGFSESLDQQFPLVVHSSRHSDEALRRLYRLMAEEYGADTLVRHLVAVMRRPDSRPDLVTIKCPTLVLVGDSDQLTPPDVAHEMAVAIPGARLVVVPKCGHLSPIERPEAVTKELVRWVGDGWS